MHQAFRWGEAVAGVLGHNLSRCATAERPTKVRQSERCALLVDLWSWNRGEGQLPEPVNYNCLAGPIALQSKENAFAH